MTSAPLVPHSASDPIWGFVAQLRAARFTGEAIVGIGPRVRLFTRQGVVYLAEREGDAPLPSRLVASGALSPEQLAKGVMIVDGVMSLSKLFVREPSADRTGIEAAIAQGNADVLAAVGDDPIVTAELHPDHHHSSGVHEWLPEPDHADLAPVDEALSVVAPTAPMPDAPPELLHMPDSSHLLDPLPAATPRRIEPIRIEPIRVEPLLSPAEPEVQHVGATMSSFAPPQLTESALLAPPPIPALVGLEQMSAFEQQFHLELAPTPEPVVEPAERSAPSEPTADDDAVDGVIDVAAAFPTVPTLPTLGSPMTWQPSMPPPAAFTPRDDLSTLDLPKLATTSKSVAEIVADQSRQAEPVDEPLDELVDEHLDAVDEPAVSTAFTPLTATTTTDPFSSLPRFADLVGDDSALSASAAQARHLEPERVEHHSNDIDAATDDATATVDTAAVEAPTPPVFETETLWTPPPADHTASEIWHLVDEMARPAAAPATITASGNDTRGHRFHLGRRSGRRSTED